MTNYLKYNLKRNIPLYIITFVICLSVISIGFASAPTSFTYNVYSESGAEFAYYSRAFVGFDSGLITSFIPIAIFSTILPFFANGYRYSLRSADTFYQIGKNKKSIRYINNLIVLISFIASFTISFVIGVILLAVRQAPFIGKETEITRINEYYYQVTEYVSYNFVYYLPVYFCLVIIAVLNYFISYFLITRANNVINSIITLILGELILGVGLMTPFWLYEINALKFTDEYLIVNPVFLMGTRSVSVIGPYSFIFHLFNGLIVGEASSLASQIDAMTNYDILTLTLTIVSLVLFVSIGGLCIYYFLNEKESSGELAGKPAPRDKFQIAIFHTGFALIGIWTANIQSAIYGASLIFADVLAVVMILSSVATFIAAYYVLYGLLRRNFKMNKKELAPFLSISISVFVIAIVLTIITFVVIYL